LRLAGPGRPWEDHVLFPGDEVECSEVGDDLAFDRPLVVEAEVLERLAAGKADRADASFGAVAVAGGDLPPQAGRQILLVTPLLRPGPIGRPRGRISQSRRAHNAEAKMSRR
jgi:hypothetical protein